MIRSPKFGSHVQRRYLAALAARLPSRNPLPERGRRWRLPLIYAILFGIPLLVLFPYTRWRPDAQFQATIKTEAVSFTTGPITQAGLFVGGDGPVDISFDGFSKVNFRETQTWKSLDGRGSGGMVDTLSGGSVLFRKVYLRRLATPDHTQVTLLWYEASKDGVTVKLVYRHSPSAQVFMDSHSVAEFRGSSGAKWDEAKDGVIQVVQDRQGIVDIFPSGNGRLNASVTPYSLPSHFPSSGSDDPAKAALRALLLKALEDEPDKRATLHGENHLPLFPGSGVAFLTDDGRGDSAILGDGSTVQIRNADRTETVLRGQTLEIDRLTNRTPSFFPGMATGESNFPSEISFQVKEDGIHVNLLGRAGALRIDGDDVRPSLAERLRKDRILTMWLALGLLVGGYLVTILARTKLVKLD